MASSSIISLDNICQKLIKLARSATEENPLKDELALCLIELKGINRSIFAEYESSRGQVEQFKESIDRGNLLLENLRYKQSHLKREIKQCRETVFTNLNKVEKELEQTLVPVEYVPDLASIKTNAFTVLSDELQQREALQAQVNALAVEQQELTARLQKKRKIIDDLPAALSTTLEANVKETTARLEMAVRNI